MKAKIFVPLLCVSVLVGLMFAITKSNDTTVSFHSEKCLHEHEHMLLCVVSDHCPNCFNRTDEFGLCPMCDYLDCPVCGNHSLPYGANCKECGFNYFDICEEHGVPYEFCGCIPGKGK